MRRWEQEASRGSQEVGAGGAPSPVLERAERPSAGLQFGSGKENTQVWAVTATLPALQACMSASATLASQGVGTEVAELG